VYGTGVGMQRLPGGLVGGPLVAQANKLRKMGLETKKESTMKIVAVPAISAPAKWPLSIGPSTIVPSPSVSSAGVSIRSAMPMSVLSLPPSIGVMMIYVGQRLIVQLAMDIASPVMKKLGQTLAKGVTIRGRTGRGSGSGKRVVARTDPGTQSVGGLRSPAGGVMYSPVVDMNEYYKSQEHGGAHTSDVYHLVEEGSEYRSVDDLAEAEGYTK